MFIKLFIQLITLISLSTLAGFLFSSLSLNFFIGFFVATVCQFLFYYAYANVLEIYVALKNKGLENERLKQLSYQSIQVTCPCHKQIKDLIPVKLNTSNYYKCRDCQKTVSILISSETAIATEPIINTEVDPLILEKIKNANS